MSDQHGSAAKQDTALLVERWLSCPIGHGKLSVNEGRITSAEPSFKGEIVDDVALMSGGIQKSFFDDKFETMQRGHERKGEWDFCYAQQTALLRHYLKPGHTILDIGCGPKIPYERPEGTFLIGLEPSFNSIRANADVDLKVCAGSMSIPMPSASVDVIVCLYSIHHMVGRTRKETSGNVIASFSEFGRVLKPGGAIFVFEMTPVFLFRAIQDIGWDTLRRIAPGTLDMYFWSASALKDLSVAVMPKDALLERIVFGTSPFTTFPPAFSLPWFKVPRFIYPLDARLYKWSLPAAPR